MVGIASHRRIALMILLLAIGGCSGKASSQGAGSTISASTVTPSPSPSLATSTPVLISGARIVVHSSTQQVAVGSTATVTAQCAPGEMLFGGDEAAGYFEQVDVSDNYPSTPDAWTASAVSGASHLLMTVDAYCLQAPATAITIVHAAGNVVDCPAGDFVLGGGYRGYRNGAVSSLPDAPRSGWRIQGSDSAEVFALCAHNGLRMEPSVSSTFTVPGAVGESTTGQADCPAGQFATGGGFSGGGVADQGAAPEFSGFSIEVQALSTVRTETVVSLCAQG